MRQVQQWIVIKNSITKLSVPIDNEFEIVLTCVLNYVAHCSSCNRKIWDLVSCKLSDNKYWWCCLRGIICDITKGK
jgi:hypothetical protein